MVSSKVALSFMCPYETWPDVYVNGFGNACWESLIKPTIAAQLFGSTIRCSTYHHLSGIRDWSNDCKLFLSWQQWLLQHCMGEKLWFGFHQYIVWQTVPLLWRHSWCDGVSNHQPRDCLLNRLFRRRSKKTSKLHGTGLCAENSPVTGEFPAQRAHGAENVSIIMPPRLPLHTVTLLWLINIYLLVSEMNTPVEAKCVLYRCTRPLSNVSFICTISHRLVWQVNHYMTTFAVMVHQFTCTFPWL